MEILLKYESISGELKDVKLRWNSCVAMGYTGRDREKVDAHIRELQRLGVSVPAEIPSKYWISPDIVYCADTIYVIGEKTSGEVEFFLAQSEEGELYFTVASDHTDRELEKVSVSKAKQICMKVVAQKCWKVSDVRDHWDEIEIASYIKTDRDSDFVLYQKGKLHEILVPEDLIRISGMDCLYEGNISILSGTIPLLVEDIIFAKAYRISISDPVLKREIEHMYRVIILPDRS